MPGWLKALLIIVVVIIVLVVGVVIAGVYWISRNKDAWIARGKEVMTEGRDFGRQSDNKGCVVESISRYKKEPWLTRSHYNVIDNRGYLVNRIPTIDILYA